MGSVLVSNLLTYRNHDAYSIPEEQPPSLPRLPTGPLRLRASLPMTVLNKTKGMAPHFTHVNGSDCSQVGSWDLVRSGKWLKELPMG